MVSLYYVHSVIRHCRVKETNDICLLNLLNSNQGLLYMDLTLIVSYLWIPDFSVVILLWKTATKDNNINGLVEQIIAKRKANIGSYVRIVQ